MVVSQLFFAEMLGIWFFILAALIVLLFIFLMDRKSKTLKEAAKREEMFEKNKKWEAIRKVLPK
ncbi:MULTISPECIES: hypothetical protein [Listeria]|uniref:hypothetical protein n=1 Tax=Listeria TaxID=1637 RepID=UPI000B592640|nr:MULTISPECIES: hypothetical protein [Listeria]